MRRFKRGAVLFITALLTIALLCGSVYAATFLWNLDSQKSTVPVYVNGLLECRGYLIDGTTYVTLNDFADIYGIEGGGWYDTENGNSGYDSDELTISYTSGDSYFIANGRYVLVPQGVKELNNVALYPATVLQKVFGYTVSWNTEKKGINVDTSNRGLLESGESYYANNGQDLLARIIFAEAGNQPFDGMIGVGNVILNRVASSTFPNNIHDVIYQSGQFDPVRNGSINNTPSSQAVLASYLVLEGMNTVGDALYFQNPSASAFLFAGLTYVTRIGDHVFYK